jgi:hypothetical protein
VLSILERANANIESSAIMKSSYISWQLGSIFPAILYYFLRDLSVMAIWGAKECTTRKGPEPEQKACRAQERCVYTSCTAKMNGSRGRARELLSVRSGAAGCEKHQVKLWCMGAGHENSLLRCHILQPLCAATCSSLLARTMWHI